MWTSKVLLTSECLTTFLCSRGFRNTDCAFKVTPRNLKGKSKSSQAWLRRQLNDPFIKRAKNENWRCRSAFKLMEMDDKYKLLSPGNIVIDCGAAPGSWTQVAVERVNANKSDPEQPVGEVIGIDLQGIMPIEGARLLCNADFTVKETQDEITQVLSGRKADIVLSDMAPSATGHKFLDHGVIIALCLSVLRFSVINLRPGGSVLCKVWMGGELHVLEDVIKQLFDTYRIVKPEACRSESAEIYLLGQNFQRNNVSKMK